MDLSLISDAVVSVDEVHCKHVGKLLKVILLDCSDVSDCPMAKDCQNKDITEKIANLVYQVLFENN